MYFQITHLGVAGSACSLACHNMCVQACSNVRGRLSTAGLSKATKSVLTLLSIYIHWVLSIDINTDNHPNAYTNVKKAGRTLRHSNARAEMLHVMENPEDDNLYMREAGTIRFQTICIKFAILTLSKVW